MTIITKLGAFVQVTDADVRAFFLNTLGIDLAGKHLKITYDALGDIAEIDADVVLTGPQTTQVEAEFFVSVTDLPSATSFLIDQGASTPTTIPISAQDDLTDILIVGNWNLRLDEIDFSLTDNDTGELQYTGAVPKIVQISYSVNTGVVNSFDHVYAALMRTPDGFGKDEIVGSRMYIETINGNDGIPIANSITIKLNPLDKIKINIANNDGTTDMMVSIATMTVK